MFLYFVQTENISWPNTKHYGVAGYYPLRYFHCTKGADVLWTDDIFSKILILERTTSLLDCCESVWKGLFNFIIYGIEHNLHSIDSMLNLSYTFRFSSVCISHGTKLWKNTSSYESFDIGRHKMILWRRIHCPVEKTKTFRVLCFFTVYTRLTNLVENQSNGKCEK